MPDADEAAQELVPVLVATVEWLTETSVGLVGLELELVQEEAAPVQVLRGRWSLRIHEAVAHVLGQGLVGVRQLAVAMLEHLVARALEDGDVPAEWPAALVLRTPSHDELQVRVRASLCQQADGPG